MGRNEVIQYLMGSCNVSFSVVSSLSPDIQLELVKTACLLLQEEYHNQGSLNEAVVKKITTAVSQMANELFFSVSQVYP